MSAGRAALERLRVTPLEDWPSKFLEFQGCDAPEDPGEAELTRAVFVELLREDLQMLEEELAGVPMVDELPMEAYESQERLRSAGVTRAMGFER